MALGRLLPRRAPAISTPEPVKLRAMEGVLNMANVGASILVLSVVVWMTWLGAKPPSLFHATAAAPRYQVGASGGSPFLEVYREKLAIGSLYLIARARVTSGTEVPSWAEQSHAG